MRVCGMGLFPQSEAGVPHLPNRGSGERGALRARRGRIAEGAEALC